MSQDTKARMQQAATYIKNKEYDEAISILATIDHPTADKWRERAESALQAETRQRKAKRSNRLKRVLQVIGVIVLVLAVAFGALYWYYTAGYGNIEFNVAIMCVGEDNCDDEYILENYLPEVRECRKRHGDVQVFANFQ